MTLIVEDGTGINDAESYATVSYADTYHTKRGNSNWDVLGTTDKEIALRKATDYMVQMYRKKWKGYKVSADQALDWPRTLVFISNEVVDNIVPLSSSIVPNEIKNACVELALKTLSNTLLLEDTEQQQVLKESIGPISTEYQPSAAKNKLYTAINAILAPFLKNSPNMVIR